MKLIIACLKGCFAGFLLVLFIALAYFMCRYIDNGGGQQVIENICPFVCVVSAVLNYIAVEHSEVSKFSKNGLSIFEI